jgi:hypothetical protein
MKISISKDDLGQDRTPAPAGTYRSTITKVSAQASAEKKTPMLKIEHTLRTQGPDSEVNTVGKKVIDFILLTPEAIWKANLYVNACTGKDIETGDWTVEELEAFISNSILNKDCTLDLSIDSFTDPKQPEKGVQSRNKISKIHAMQM